MPTTEISSFWEKARAQLAQVPLDASVEPVKADSDVTVTTNKVILNSFENVKIRAWYSIPTSPAPPRGWPAVMVVPGFVGTVILPGFLAQFGYATLTLYPRGQGESQHEWKLGGDTGTIHYKLASNMMDPECQYYRAVYMDCIRGLDLLDSRPEVDSARMAVFGSSQGGGLTLAMAALDGRLKAAVARLPSLCNLPLAVELRAEGCADVQDYLAEHPQDRATVMKNLAYIDNLNLADGITCPTIFSVAQVDDNHPFSTVFPVFDKIQALKSMVVYPDATGDHTGEVNVDFNQHMLGWLQRYL